MVGLWLETLYLQWPISIMTYHQLGHRWQWSLFTGVLMRSNKTPCVRPRASPMWYLAPRERSTLAAYLVLPSPSASLAIITISILTITTVSASLFWPSLITGLYVYVREKENHLLFLYCFIHSKHYLWISKHLAGNRTGIQTVFCPLEHGNFGRKTNGLGAPEFCQGLCL